MSIYPVKSYHITHGLSEFEILKASHKFLREDDNETKEGDEAAASTNVDGGGKRWEDQLAEKYYENLYREFAVCDLKHYKSGNFALRWRIESEVLSGAGESTCGNTRCKHHPSSSPSNDDFVKKKGKRRRREPQLTTLELPFAYIEHGGAKNALVKVALCTRCVKKLMWKRRKDKEEREMRERGFDPKTLDGLTGESGESDEEEDEAEKTEKMGKGREREREREKEGRRLDKGRNKEDDEGLQRRSIGGIEIEGRGNGKKDGRNERDSHVERHKDSTRESGSRRRSSRSRSPRRRRSNSHSIHSHSYSKNRSREYGRNA